MLSVLSALYPHSFPSLCVLLEQIYFMLLLFAPSIHVSSTCCFIDSHPSPRHSLFLSLIQPSLPLSLPHPTLTLSFSPSPSSRQEFKNRARSLEYLSGIITDLFVDWHRLRGVDSRRKIGDLQRAIMASGDDFDGLINAFFTLPNAPSQSHNR